MGSILRILGVAAVAVAGLFATAWSVLTAAVVPMAAVTGLVMGGTGSPLMNVGPIATPDTATHYYLDWTKNRYIKPSLQAGDTYSTDHSGSVAVYTPEEFWPQPGHNLTFNDSVKYGLTNLTTCARGRTGCVYNSTVNTGAAPLPNGPVGDNRYLVFGYSQSARIATNLKQSLVANYNATGWDGVPKMDFVLIGNPNRPNGGILERFNGLSIPFFGITFDGATPTDSDCAHGCKFNTTDFSGQYDGYSDFPRYPLNVLADLNALAGIFTVHGFYYRFDTTKTDGTINPDAIIDQGRHGDTRYYMIPTAQLPILNVIENIIPNPVRGWIDPVFTLLEAPLRAVIETGYDRDLSPGVASPMRLIRLKPLTDLLTIGYAVGVGIDNAAAQIAEDPGFRPLGTVKPPANGYGVTVITPPDLFGGASPLSGTSLLRAASPSGSSSENQPSPPAAERLSIAGTDADQVKSDVKNEVARDVAVDTKVDAKGDAAKSDPAPAADTAAPEARGSKVLTPRLSVRNLFRANAVGKQPVGKASVGKDPVSKDSAGPAATAAQPAADQPAADRSGTAKTTEGSEIKSGATETGATQPKDSAGPGPDAATKPGIRDGGRRGVRSADAGDRPTHRGKRHAA